MNIPTETKPPVTPGGYEALVEEAKKPIVQARRRLLAYYWELGRVAADALKPEFGSRTVERFAKDLGLECATVHFAVQFYDSYRSKQALEKVSERGLSRPWLPWMTRRTPDASTSRFSRLTWRMLRPSADAASAFVMRPSMAARTTSYRCT